MLILVHVLAALGAWSLVMVVWTVVELWWHNPDEFPELARDIWRAGVKRFQAWRQR